MFYIKFLCFLKIKVKICEYVVFFKISFLCDYTEFVIVFIYVNSIVIIVFNFINYVSVIFIFII